MEIRKLFWVALALLSLPIVVVGQTSIPYFCNREGAVLEYERWSPKGEIKWYHQMKIEKISLLSEGGEEVKYSSRIVDKKGKSQFGDTAIVLKGYLKDGYFTMNMGESVETIIKSMIPEGVDIDIHIAGGESVLPPNLTPGDTLPPIHTSVTILGMSMKVSVTERKVLRFETIETPAGSFECVVVRERKKERGLGRSRHTIADTWYSKGVGMVRHDTYSPKLKLQTSEILVKSNLF